MAKTKRVKKGFDFLKLIEKEPKPRKSGVIEIRGSYYSPVGLTYLKDILDIASEYVDGFKFAGGSQRLHPLPVLKKILKTCHDYGLYVSTGGFIERVIVQGPKAVDQYLEECKSLGFDVVEVSSGLAPIKLSDKIAITKQIRKLGMKAKPEVAFAIGAGAGTQVGDYGLKLRSVKEVTKEAKAYLKAGAYMLMFESEGVTEDMPFKEWRTDLIEKMVKETGLNNWMFESADPAVFKWYLRKYGPNVNLFIDHSQIIEYEAWRSQLWGDPRIWEGKKIRYK